MGACTIPHYTPKYDGSGFIKVNVPYWNRAYICDYGRDTCYATFAAIPSRAFTPVLFEVYDGEDYRPVGAVEVQTARLISASDSGFYILETLVRATFFATIQHDYFIPQ